MVIQTNLIGRTVKGGYSESKRTIVAIFVDRGQPELILERENGYLETAYLGNVQLEREPEPEVQG